MARTSAEHYQRSGQLLDQHVEACPVCGSGSACADGDDTAEGEYRAWRRWESDDPDAARTAQRRRQS